MVITDTLEGAVTSIQEAWHEVMDHTASLCYVLDDASAHANV